MAAIARRTFDLLKDEHVRRVGRDGDTNYTASSGRAEQFVTAAYFDICRLWHHHELDASSTGITLATSAASASISSLADLDIVVAVVLRAVSGGAVIKGLTKTEDVAGLLAEQRDSGTVQPKKYGRLGTTLHFDTKPDATYPTTIYYYKIPTAPDFGAGTASPAIKRVWDEHLLQYSVALAREALWTPEHVPAGYQLLQDYLSKTPEPLLVSGTVVERGLTPKTVGGATG